jgi:hypothetical protein
MNQTLTIKNALTSFLGLPSDAGWTEINERAKEIGSFSEVLIKKKEEEEDNFRKLERDG